MKKLIFASIVVVVAWTIVTFGAVSSHAQETGVDVSLTSLFAYGQRATIGEAGQRKAVCSLETVMLCQSNGVAYVCYRPSDRTKYEFVPINGGEPRPPFDAVLSEDYHSTEKLRLVSCTRESIKKNKN